MNDSGIETVMDPVVPLEALLEIGEPVSWSRRQMDNQADKVVEGRLNEILE